MARYLAPVLFLLLVLPAFADTHETQTVELVQVPVYVSTADGAVTGLTRDNFELKVNGRRQPIDYFDVIDFATATPVSAEQRVDPKQRRLYVLVFDLFYSSGNEVHRAQQAAEHYLSGAAPADVFAIATYKHNTGLEIVVPFTRDRVALRRAIAALNASYAADPLHLQVLGARSAATGREEDWNPPLSPAYIAGREVRLDPLRSRVQDQIEGLRALAKSLMPIEGQKHVVLLSSGYNTVLLTGSDSGDLGRGDIRSPFLTNRPSMSAQPRHGGFIEPNGQALMSLRNLAKEYARAAVFLDAVDIGGIRPFGTVFSSDSLYAYADATGGSVVHNRNDLTQALQVLTDKQRMVYVLSFHARPDMKAQNSISVRLRGVEGHPDLHYRQSFTRTIEGAGTENALHLADILLNDTPQNGIPVQSAVTTTEGTATVAVEIGGRELAAQLEGNATADVMLYVFSGTSAVAFNEKKIDIDLSKAAAALQQKPIRFDQQFSLPAGTYAAKILVRLGDSSFGFSRTDFTIAR